MKRSNNIRLYGITVAGTYSFCGDCTITKDKSADPKVQIQIDNEFIDEINPKKVPLYLKNDGFYNYIPYSCGEDLKIETARRYAKMWTSVTLFALHNHINPKSLFSLVIFCTKNREDAPEITLRKWEKDNEKIEFPGIIELVEKAQGYSPENNVHNWVREKINTYVSVQPYF